MTRLESPSSTRKPPVVLWTPWGGQTVSKEEARREAVRRLITKFTPGRKPEVRKPLQA